MAGIKEASSNFCGNCQFFDKNNVDGIPFGENNAGGIKGVCRAPKGFVLGVLNNKSPCKQPVEVFNPKEVKATW